MRASGPVKRTGRADKARQLAGRADAPRELFFLTRRSFCAICRRYGWARPQLRRAGEYEHKAKYAWRALVSMRISTGWSREAVARPAALPDRRRADGRKTGGPTCEKGVRCAPPTHAPWSQAHSVFAFSPTYRQTLQTVRRRLWSQGIVKNHFIIFLNWVAFESGRAKSFNGLERAFGMCLARLELTNWTNRPRVKAVTKEIKCMLGVEPDPCAIPSRRIARIAIKRTLPIRCKSNASLLKRSLMLLACELGSGFRVGEATGAGEGHGVFANDCFIAKIESGEFRGEIMVVLKIEDSKTGFGRECAIFGTTKGPLSR